MRALIYVRQSVAREESISLEVQEAACRMYAQQRGYNVVAVHSDPGISGLQFDKRPGIKAAIAAVEAGTADVVLCWRWSRLSRKRTDQAVILDRIESAGGRAESAVEPIDTTTAGGRFSRDVLLSMAAFESEQKSEQWGEAHKRRLDAGLPPSGGRRFGYIGGGKDDEQKTYSIDPVNGPILRTLYERYIAGSGIPRLVSWLNENDVKTTRGQEWNRYGLQAVLDAGFAAGRHVWGGVEHWGSWEPILTRAEWAAYLRARDARRVSDRRASSEWVLSGLVRCGQCGAPMRRTKARIRCSAEQTRGKSVCPGTSMYSAEIDHRVALLLGGIQEEWAAAMPAPLADRAPLEERVSAAEKQIADLGLRLGRLAAGWADGLLDDQGYATARGETQRELAEAEADKKDAEASLSALAASAENPLDVIAERSQDMDVEQFREVYKQLFTEVRVFPDRYEIEQVNGHVSTTQRGTRGGRSLTIRDSTKRL